MDLKPRLLRRVRTPLGNYLRPGRNDHKVLSQLLAESRLDYSGLVVDPRLVNRHSKLPTEARRQGLETVMDPLSLELASTGGFTRAGVASLPWAGEDVLTPSDFSANWLSGHVAAIAEFLIEEELSAVLAPVHLLCSLDDPWLGVDARITEELRASLDENGEKQLPIYYPLAIYSRALQSEQQLKRLLAYLDGLPIDAVWLRVQPFGVRSGSLTVRRYIHACRRLHDIGLPIVGERTGSIGLALAAFGAIGGIESGVTFGEHFDANPLKRKPTGKPFLPAPRVYFPQIGAFLSRKNAQIPLDQRGMKSFLACQNRACCPRGHQDMISDPRRHFAITRARELRGISDVPVSVRADHYLDEVLRPATDRIIRASKHLPELVRVRKRLDGWRTMFSSLREEDIREQVSHSEIPRGKRLIRKRGA